MFVIVTLFLPIFCIFAANLFLALMHNQKFKNEMSIVFIHLIFEFFHREKSKLSEQIHCNEI